MDTSLEEHVFVLRIWKEAPPKVGWRATITDLKSGCKVAATELRDIADFVRLRISPTQDGPP